MIAAEMGSSFIIAMSAIFVVVEPFGAAPTFAALTAGRSEDEIRSIALRASVVGAAVLAGVSLFGGPVLGALHIQLDAFRAAGGLLLLLTALEMLRGRATRCAPAELSAEREDVAIVPIAVPLLAGPGAMAAVMVLVAEAGPVEVLVVLAAVAITFAVTYAVLRAAGQITVWAGPSGIAVIQRVFGLLLAALAVQFVVMGISGLLGWAVGVG